MSAAAGRSVCHCGKHFFSWSERRWLSLTPAGPKPADGLTCTRGRGDDASSETRLKLENARRVARSSVAHIEAITGRIKKP